MMATTARSGSVNWAGLAATLLVFGVVAACVRLGFWQLDRLEGRRLRNERLAERMALPPIELAAPPPDTAGWLYRRVIVHGRYDDERSVVLPARFLRGVLGLHVVTPLLLAPGGQAVLVNRGWLPSADGIHVDPAAFLEPGPVSFEGLVLPFFGPESSLGQPRAGDSSAPSAEQRDFSRVWFTIDEPALRAQFPYLLGRVHIQALPSGDPAAGPQRLPAPSLSEGPHLSYAIQWFSFAAIALIGWAALVRRSRKRGTKPPVT
jgi:surfeit locus 1 family protein